MVVSVALFLIPVIVAMAAAAVLVRVIPKPRSDFALGAWWALVIIAPWVVYVGVSRFARRAVPLAALLKMTLVFPDQAPSRLAVARRAGSTRTLERQLQLAEEQGARDDLSIAAENILALATSLNRHDRLTRGHSERVRALTDLIADQLRLPTGDRDRLRWSALLHDIGKLTVPVAILNKADAPDSTEWKALLGHPLEGQRLAEPLADWLGDWAATIPEHHEKFDGTGYPYGLKGEEISLGGRIVAVADSYDAMTSVRSYSRGMSPEAARQELAACAGTHFDPTVVRAFLEVSVGRHDLLGAPLAWLGELVTVNGVPELGQVVTRLGNVVAGLVATAGIATVIGIGVHHPPSIHKLEMAASAAPSTSAPSPKPTATAPRPPLRPSIVVQRNVLTAPPATTPPVSSGEPPAIPTTNPQDPPSEPPRPPDQAQPVNIAPPPPPVTPATVPGAPSHVSATAGNGSATVTWAPPASDGGRPVTTYVITAYVGGTATLFAGVGNVTSDVVGGLTNGTTYSFTVAAVNPVGPGTESTHSDPVTPATVPEAPSHVSATAGNASATVTWAPPGSDGGRPVTTYVITAYVGGTAKIFAGVGDVKGHVVGGLTNGTTYSFTVTAVNPIGPGTESAHSDPVTPATVPGAPSGVSATAGNGSATVTWTAPASDGGSPVTGYKVVATDSTTPANGEETCDWTAGPLTCTVTGLTDGDSYSFSVAAGNVVGLGPSSPASPPLIPATVPGAPSGVSATAGNASATVTWTAPATDGGRPVTTYVITAYVGGTASMFAGVGNVTSDVVSGLTNGTTYSFTVTAVNPIGPGTDSAHSDPVTPATVPGAPSGVSATAGDADATVTWTAPASDGGSPVTGYTVVATDSTTPANGGETCEWKAGPLTCTVTGLTDGDSYSFAVTAGNIIGLGPSSPASPALTPATVPGAPSGVSATAGNASATVTWTAPATDGGSPVTGYAVVATDSTTPANGGETCNWTAGPLTCTVTGLTDGDSYSFAVTAGNVIGPGVSAVSSAVIPGTAPDPPAISLVTVGIASATIAWTPPVSDGGAPVTSYTVVAGDVTTPANGGETCTWTAGPLACTVTGLTIGDTYVLGVSATNDVGTSTTEISGYVTPIP